PYAFLGGSYLDVIADFYTNVSDDDIFIKKPFSKLIFGSDSLRSSLPLQKLIEENIDEDFLKKVAEEHKKGRRLYIGTTNLDAKRLVIWNMGHIAEIGDERALELFQKIILASAAMPVALNPIYFSVEANGKVYDEMHVDGGVTVQVFFYGSILNIESAIKTLGIEDKPKVRLFIIRNAIIKPDYEAVKPRISSIAGSSLSNLIRNDGIGDLYRIYTISQRDGFEFNLASLPPDYQYEKKGEFDPGEMKLLYDLGYKAAINGYPWEKYPPLY
ncbi:MAG: patatin family protein, partial [Candidatus Dadabacteria bacterium]|nr:patatin family protein [Candidatus Dadabacteria bacterium]NIQ13868.1 patatin family protein [Candidatus Dadabacteria bacterium]